MKLVIISFIVAIVMFVADHGKADHNIRHGTWKLDEILKDTDWRDYRKEMTESAFKPCLQHLLRKRGNLDDVFLESILKDLALELRKMEPGIYYEVKNQDTEMRFALYAVVAAQCKKKVDEDW